MIYQLCKKQILINQLIVEKYTDFEIQGKLYRIQIAKSLHLRQQAYRLMYELYVGKGWQKPHPSGKYFSLYEILPDSVTIVAMHEDSVVATLTTVSDSPLGLPDDKSYEKELDQLRQSGCRLSQIISLGIEDSTRGMKTILAKLFNFVYLVARYIKGSTHFVHTVVPHHVRFYLDQFLFHQIGEERFQEKTSTNVKLLALPLNIPGAVKGSLRKSTFYKYFLPKYDESLVIANLSQSIQRISQKEFNYFLSQRSEIISKANQRQQMYIMNMQKGYSLCLY